MAGLPKLRKRSHLPHIAAWRPASANCRMIRKFFRLCNRIATDFRPRPNRSQLPPSCATDPRCRSLAGRQCNGGNRGRVASTAKPDRPAPEDRCCPDSASRHPRDRIPGNPGYFNAAAFRSSRMPSRPAASATSEGVVPPKSGELGSAPASMRARTAPSRP